MIRTKLVNNKIDWFLCLFILVGKLNSRMKTSCLFINVCFLKFRHETTVLQTKDVVPDSGTYNRNKFENTSAKVELPNRRKSDIKENLPHHKTELNDTPKTLASSIKARRKSTPAVSMPIDAFSSDDEMERNYQTKDSRTDHLSKDKFERRNSNKIPLDKYSNKTSETSNADDRGCIYHESTTRDTYKSKSNKHHDNSSYRGRDKYEVSLKYRKHYSPERGLKRPHTEYHDDHYRQEQGRYQGRSLESPPPESYSRHQRRNRDYRSDYDKHCQDHEKHRHHYEEKYSAKYRSNGYDEPYTKRQKAESYGKHDAHFKDDRRYYLDKDSVDVQSIPEFSPHEYDILRLSCQSPDSVNTDAAFANPIKEIMATAASPLEDPRETSNRYVIKKENGKETLSTVVGRNINIKSVNKAEWNIEPVNIPVALVRRPSQCSYELVKDVYMDIDNPVTNLNLSMESGEICEIEDGNHKIRSKPKIIQHDSQHFKISKQVTEGLSKLATNLEKVSKPNIAKYRIPKIGQNNKNTQSKIDVPITDLAEIVPHHKNVHKKGEAGNSFPKELLPHKQHNNERDEFLSSNITYSKKEGKSEDQNQTTLAKMAIVADDLELSDDNSDNVDTNRRVIPEPVQKNCKMQLKVPRKEDSENNVSSISSHNTKIEKAVDNAGIKNITEEEKTKESDSIKKQKIKKKKSKSREISKELVESTADADVPEKKTRSKKEKEGKPKETKEKFSDLFGDSSSLMTPEDLGIPSYLPISEDAQDAIDMKINQIIDASPSIDKEEISGDMQTQNSVEIKKQGTATHDVIPEDVSQKSSTEVVEDKEAFKDTKKKKSSKSKEEILVPCNKLPSPVVYENLNPGTDSNDPDIVKTVIISTGLQPEITFENNKEVALTKPATDIVVNAKQNTTDNNPIPAIIEFKRHDILKALATSTPQKEFAPVNTTDVAVGTTDVIYDSDVSKADAMIPNAEQVVNQADTNTLDSHDAPDVRIFVKRRRKVVKRPPMT